jgi:hypothetical protein
MDGKATRTSYGVTAIEWVTCGSIPIRWYPNRRTMLRHWKSLRRSGTRALKVTQEVHDGR